MAEGGVDFTICSICLDPFDEPRILPCGHSFCTECLKNIIGGGNKTCPDCRENIPNKRAEEFPKNYGLIAAVTAPRSREQKSTSEKCTKHNLPKKYFCRGKSCSVAICKKCWTSNHTGSPHDVVPIEAELETALSKVSLNTDTIMDFQNKEKSILQQFSKQISFHESALKKTEELVQYQLKSTTSCSTSELSNYETTIMEKCVNKKRDIQIAKNQLISLLENADAGLDELIKHLQTNSVQSGTKLPPTIPIERNPNKWRGRFQSVTEMIRAEFPGQYNDVVFDSTSEHIFARYISKCVDVFDLQLRKQYSFKLQIERVVNYSIAISGNGTLYVTCKQGEQIVTSAVDKKTGEVIRNIHSDNNCFKGMSAHGNRLVIAHRLINQKNTVEVCVYDNETLTKTLQLQTYSAHYTLASLDYLLYFQLERYNRVQLVILNIAHSNVSQKFVVHLDEIRNWSSFVWIWNKSCNSEEVTSGYLFITDEDSSPLRPLVYEIDLSTVKDRTTLSPLNIPFNFKHKYEKIWFLSAVGNDSILCSITHDGKEKLAIFRMQFD